MRDHGNDVTVNVTRDGGEHARPLVEEIADLVPQILAQMGKPQLVKCPVPVPPVMLPEVMREADLAIVYEDDHEEEPS